MPAEPPNQTDRSTIGDRLAAIVPISGIVFSCFVRKRQPRRRKSVWRLMVVSHVVWMLILPGLPRFPGFGELDSWPAMIVASQLLVVLALKRPGHEPRFPLGLCQTCGYDLRASKKCCPECGTPIAPKPR